MDSPPDPVAAVAALEEPTRRRLYDYVARAHRPVGRDEAATAVGVPRATAAFHLERLADQGLLSVEHKRLSGRTGPGAGRPAKLYRRSAGPVQVSLPPRSYDLAGQLLADAIEEADRSGLSVRDALSTCASSAGRLIGESADEPDPLPILESHGFEPHQEAGRVVLRNCPFHDLARRHTALVCGMNLDLLSGVLEGLDCSSYKASLRPRQDHCCVVLTPTPAR